MASMDQNEPVKSEQSGFQKMATVIITSSEVLPKFGKVYFILFVGRF